MGIRSLGIGLGVIAILTCGACAQRGEKLSVSVDPTPAAASEPAAATGGSQVAAGRAFYEANDCASCHGKDGGGGFQGSRLRGGKASVLLSFLDGTGMHGGGTVEGMTTEDAAHLEAYLAESP